MMFELEEFYKPRDIQIFREIKGFTMKQARIARAVAAEMVGFALQGSGKEFLTTDRGTYRLAMRRNSDNSTEAEAHAAMGAETVYMSDPKMMAEFFRDHGLNGRPALRFENEAMRRMKALP